MKNLPYIFLLLALLSSCDEKSNSNKQTEDVLTDTLITENDAKAENDDTDNPLAISPIDINRHIFYTENKNLPDTLNIHIGKELEKLIIDTFTASYNLVISDIESKYKPITIDYFYKGFYLIEFVEAVFLKDVKNAFIYYTNFDECPSSTYQTLVLVTDNKLIKLVDMLKEADEENLTEPEFDNLNVYLPISANGEILFKKVGFFEDPESEHRDESFFKGKIKEGIPLSELYIIEKIKITDEEKQSKSIKFYRWDGRNSTVIK
jgi:hypothetical protein